MPTPVAHVGGSSNLREFPPAHRSDQFRRTVAGRTDDLSVALEVSGKEFVVAGRPHRLCGVTYGTFRPRSDGARYPEITTLRRDLAAMAYAGFNTVRTYTPPPDDMLAAAVRHGLRTFAGIDTIDWRYTVGRSRRQRAALERESISTIRREARRLRGRTEVAAFCIGNEIPADVVRWYGTDGVERTIARLVEAVKCEDPDRLVTYANYPTAEYLHLPTLDFVTFNVFLEDAQALRSYLGHLHHTTHDRPLVLGEFGRHVDGGPAAEQFQAQLLDDQHHVALDRGVAGAFVFAWTDEWHVGSTDVDDWSFGLTTGDRTPRPALDVCTRWNAATLADLRPNWPRISVVVCARNEEATIGECLTHATTLEYPDYEVIVVDDGSTDRTPQITADFSDVRLISDAPRWPRRRP